MNGQIENLALKLQVSPCLLLEIAEEGKVYSERDIREYMKRKQDRATAHLRSLRFGGRYRG